MANKKRPPKEEWEIIATKRKWTYVPIILSIIIGLLFCLSVVLVEMNVVVLLTGLLFAGVSLYLLITKLITPNAIIIYDRSRAIIKVRTWRYTKDIPIAQIQNISASWRLAYLIINIKNEKSLMIEGISHLTHVADVLTQLVINY